MSKVWSKLYVEPDDRLAQRCKDLGAEVLFLCAKERQHPGETFGGIEVHRLPLADDPKAGLDRKSLALAMNGALAAATAAANGRRVVISCVEGEDRSPFIAALALERAGIDAETAIARVRAACPGALQGNPRFVAILQRVVGSPDP